MGFQVQSLSPVTASEEWRPTINNNMRFVSRLKYFDNLLCSRCSSELRWIRVQQLGGSRTCWGLWWFPTPPPYLLVSARHYGFHGNLHWGMGSRSQQHLRHLLVGSPRRSCSEYPSWDSRCSWVPLGEPVPSWWRRSRCVRRRRTLRLPPQSLCWNHDDRVWKLPRCHRDVGVRICSHSIQSCRVPVHVFLRRTYTLALCRSRWFPLLWLGIEPHIWIHKYCWP